MKKFVLALDSAHDACSAAVVSSDGKTAASVFEEMERGQAEALMPAVQEAMRRAGISFDDLAYIAVTTGPGSFTGVRVGLAAARGIAMAARLPMIGVSVCEASAFDFYKAHPEEQRTLGVVLETKRDDFYACFFKNGVAASEPAVMCGADLAALKGVIFVGNGVRRLIEENAEVPFADMPMPTAETAALLSLSKTPSETYPSPLYLREAEVSACRK